MLTMRYLTIILVAAGLAQAQSPAFIGAGGCASSNCHGAATEAAAAESRIRGNEFTAWSTQDKHARAYQVLTDERGKRMTAILKISDPVEDKRCAPCHVAGSPGKSLSDGVACEACHGAAEKWLGPHTQTNSHEMNVRNNGMTDTKDLAIRAKTCLKCHMGSGDQMVTHELIAAGHPDLAFELDTFTVAQPAHHRMPSAALRVRAWAVGQTMALAEQMRLISAHTAKNWPEFSDLECYQCHHDLHRISWRIARGYGSRRPGSLQVNVAHVEIVRDLVSVAAPEERSALESLLARLDASLADGAATGQAGKAVERIADTLTERFQKQDIDAVAVLKAVSADIERIAAAGVNAAEQATMTLDALGAALGRNPDLTKPLYDYLEHPSQYKPSEFVARYQKASI
jgi:hypothetical protein